MDPMFPAVVERLRDSALPLLDIGCGLGLVALLLRQAGSEVPVLGLDYDVRKIRSAIEAAARFGAAGLDFRQHDAREELPQHQGNVCILDIMQFFRPEEQQALLAQAVARVAPGGQLIIRATLRDSSWRYRMTILGDALARGTFWMKAGAVYYPDRAVFESALGPHGSLSITPLYKGTPFNNFLIVLQRNEGC